MPLIIQDRRFDGDGQLDYELGMKDSIVGFEGLYDSCKWCRKSICRSSTRNDALTYFKWV